jgi:hypothetical protein
MAMTKKEQAAFADLECQSREWFALRWRDFLGQPTSIDVGQEIKQHGWGFLLRAWTFCTHTKEVFEGCTDGNSHAVKRTDRVTSQGMYGPWYRTKREALMALRLAVQEEFAKELAKIDAAIEAESNSPSHSS